MSEKRLTVGDQVQHTNKPEWGPGVVTNADSVYLWVSFRDLSEGGTKKNPMQFHQGTPFLQKKEGPPDLWLSKHSKGKDGKNRTFKQHGDLDWATKVFLHMFPEGFQDTGYTGDPSDGERFYKLKAHERYVSLLGDGQGESLLADGKVAEVTKRIKQVLKSPMNLLAVQEQIAFLDGLKDEGAAKKYYLALFQFISLGSPQQDTFENLAAAMKGMRFQKGKTPLEKWTNFTLLPFLANPGAFMFLKPEPSKMGATWFPKYDLQYDARPNWVTYSRLLGLCDLLREKLLEHPSPYLHPRIDFIDLQSFLWLVWSDDKR